MAEIHPNYQALLDYATGSLSSQGKFPDEPCKYISSNGARCIIGLLLPERLIDQLDNRSIGYGELNTNTDSLEYISNTFGLPNTPVFCNIITQMQIEFDREYKNFLNIELETFIQEYKDIIHNYILRVTKYEFNNS